MLDRTEGIEKKMKELSSYRRHLFFLAFLAVISLVFLSSLIKLYNLSLSSEMYSHLLLIPFVTAYLVFQNRKKAFSCAYQLNRAALFLLVGATFALIAASLIHSHLSLSIASFIFLLWSGFVFFYGITCSRAVLFPLFFLVFLIPAPGILLDKIIIILLWGSDQVTAFLFSLTGVPFIHENYIYRLPRLSIYIAPECSGIRSSTALLLTAVLADYLILTRVWTRTLLLLAVLPLAVFKNGLRIVTLSLLTIYVDPGFMSGDLHSRGGFVFFGITLLIMGIILLLLRKAEGLSGRNSSTSD